MDRTMAPEKKTLARPGICVYLLTDSSIGESDLQCQQLTRRSWTSKLSTQQAHG